MSYKQTFIKRFGYDPDSYGWANAPTRTAASYRIEAADRAKMHKYALRPVRYTAKRKYFSRYIPGKSKARRSLKRYSYPRRYYAPRIIYRNKTNYLNDYLNRRTAAALAVAQELANTQPSIVSAISAINPDTSMDATMIDTTSDTFDKEFSRELKRRRDE
jgi:hypothetical protein